MNRGFLLLSKFSGRCGGCKTRYEPNEAIVYYGKGQPVYHFECWPESDRPADWKTFKQDGFIFTDLETSGLNPHDGTDDCGNEGPCAIVQIAAIATTNNFVIKDTFSSLIQVNPRLLYHEEAMAVHHFTEEDLANAPEEYDVLESFFNFCDRFPNSRFGGFNCPFDQEFIAAACKRHGIVRLNAFLLPALDLYPISKEKLLYVDMKGLYGGNKQTDVATHYGIPTKGAHNALIDLYLAVQIGRKVVIW